MPYLTDERMKQFQQEDPGIWSVRNQNIWRWRRIYALRKPPRNKLRPGQFYEVSNDPKVIVRKTAAMISNHPPAIDVPFRNDANRAAAQRAEEYLRYYREQEALKFGEGPNGDRPYTEALKLVRDGMLVDITVYDDSDPAFPFYSCLPDVTRIFPIYAGDTRLRTTYVYDTTVAELRMMMDQYGDVLDRVTDKWLNSKDDALVKVCKVFTGNRKQGYEMGVMADDTILFMSEIDFDPVTITYVIGDTDTAPDESLEPGETTRPTLSGVRANESVGLGILDQIEEALRSKNRDMSMLTEMLAREANPPKVLFTNDEGKADQIDLDAGSSMVFWAEDKFQLVNTTPDFNKFEAKLKLSQQQIERGTYGGGLYGEAQGNTGQQDYLLMGNVRDNIAPYVRGHERHLRAKYKKVLELYAAYGYQDLEYTTGRDQGEGIVLGGQVFSMSDVKALGKIQVSVLYPEVTPQNEAARANIASMLTRDHIIDLLTSRKLGVPAPYNENPEAIGERVLQDLAMMNPLNTQIMSLNANLRSPDPVQRMLAGMLLEPVIAQLQQQIMQARSGMAPGAPPTPGLPGQAGAPADNTQMSPVGNPSERGNQAGMTHENPQVGPPPSEPGG
jgi:hypothetical protein